MEKEELTREIVAVDLKGKIYTINEFTTEGHRRYALDDGTQVNQTAEYLFQIAETEVDLRTVY